MKEFLQLNIDELFDYIKSEIRYGWIDTKGVKHYSSDNDDLEYHLQTPEETLERKIGICWDICELLRYYFEKNNYKVKTYFIYLYINDNYCPSHSVLLYKKDQDCVWFEPSKPELLCGIHYYKTEKDFLIDMKQKFIQNGLRNDFFTEDDDLTKLSCYEFQKPLYGIRGSEYYNHCRTGRKINIKLLTK